MDKEKIAAKWSDLIFGVRRAIRYHNSRKIFFDSLGDWTNFLTILGGGCVVFFVAASTTGRSTAAIVFGALVSALTALDLVLGYAVKARQHADLSRQFYELEQKMADIGDSPIEEELKTIIRARLEIEAKGPFILRVLEATCHNEVARAMGWPSTDLAEIGFWQDIFKQFFDFQADKLIDPR
jgi:hypothetical protein